MTADLLVLIPLAVRLAAASMPAADHPLVGADKVKHFLVGGFAQAVTHAGLRAVGTSPASGQAGGMVVVSAAALWKEWRDARAGGRASVADVAWTLAGGAAMAALLSRTVR